VGDSLGCFLVGGLMCFWILGKILVTLLFPDNFYIPLLYLARSGLTIVMIGRTFEKMNLVFLATDQKVKVMQADFAKNSVYKNIEKDLKDLDIGVLVNNVGMLHNPLPCRFLNGQDIEEVRLFCGFQHLI
uniref:Uncharacterized protein n=1 Tax=Corvus moneduloides TaxID=1196302 RepID=A0A8U7NMI1_CORMO